MGAINFSLDEKLLEMLCRELPLKRFVETGTYQGATLRAARRFFAECHSVELFRKHYEAAVENFAGQQGVFLHRGESPPWLLERQSAFAAEPALFWLDAHWCGSADTAGEGADSPLLAELAAIGRLHPQSVILIDDARAYLCAPAPPVRPENWPDFHRVVLALLALSPSHRLTVLNDVIIFYPESIQAAVSRFSQKEGVDWATLAYLARKYQDLRRLPWFLRVFKIFRLKQR